MRRKFEPLKIMASEKYHLKFDNSLTVFEFTSVGTRGPVQKLIKFQQMDQQAVCNIAFGDKNPETDELNDLAVTNNGDVEKVFATNV